MSQSGSYQIYVDGSYINGKIGYGIVILKNEELIEELNGQIRDPLANSSRQVGGEIIAVQKALEWCEKEEVAEVDLFYDFSNVKKWATGEYRTKIPLTKRYKEFIDGIKTRVNWNKVKAHSGDKWNERADRLAKEGAGIKEENDYKAKEDKLVDELEKKSEKFVSYIQKRGYSAQFKGIYNGNCAKLKLNDGINDIGHLNIYNTKKLHLVPKFHELTDKSFQQDLLQLWQSFLK